MIIAIGMASDSHSITLLEREVKKPTRLFYMPTKKPVANVQAFFRLSELIIC